mmetsp:Transcript_104085/g.303881  ORF Transcript_104085/g.303881 Transcript_104085/m.303881 type:complete len:454 (+) Transcript_104085:83-1444(+)
MEGPDLDALFGAEPPPSAPGPTSQSSTLEGPARPHPALVLAVENLLSEAWPRAAGELRSPPSDRPAELCSELAARLDTAAEAARGARWAACAQAAQATRSAAWESLFGGSGWKRNCERELFMLAELLLGLSDEARGDQAAAISRADSVFVFAAAGAFRDAALLFVRWLDDEAREKRQATSQMPASTVFCSASRWARGACPASWVAVARWHMPAREKLHDLLRAREPFVVTGALEHWPARERWASLTYLDATVGHRIVPVEVGSKVGSSQWREELMPLWTFLSAYLAPSCEYCSHWLEPRESCKSGVAYLAQHELLEQCPALRSDMGLPEDWKRVLGKPTRTNVWLGTHGTVTPCHWDSYDNFLAQVQGTKRAILLAPKEKGRLYVEASGSGTSSQGNISQVDVEAPDLERFPEFANAQCLVAELAPGDALFIPQGWWHQVRALTPSFSVNFWF